MRVSPKVAKAKYTLSPAVSLAADNVQIQELTLVKVSQKFTVFVDQHNSKKEMN